MAMRRVRCEYNKTSEGSPPPARSSAEALEASLIRTCTIRSPYGGRCSPELGLVRGGWVTRGSDPTHRPGSRVGYRDGACRHPARLQRPCSPVRCLFSDTVLRHADAKAARTATTREHGAALEVGFRRRVETLARVGTAVSFLARDREFGFLQQRAFELSVRGLPLGCARN